MRVLRSAQAGLPPVQVPLEALVEGPLVPIEEPGPSAPGLLVGLLQISHVVGFEARRAAAVVCLEKQGPPALRDAEPRGGSPERRACRLHAQSAVEALRIV